MKKIVVSLLLCISIVQLKAMHLVPLLPSATTALHHTIAAAGLVTHGIKILVGYYTSNTSEYDKDCTDADPEVVAWVQKSFKDKPMPFSAIKIDWTIPSPSALATVDKQILYLPEKLFIFYKTPLPPLTYIRFDEFNVSESIKNLHSARPQNQVQQAQTKRLEELAAMIQHLAAHIQHQDQLFEAIFAIAVPILGQSLLHISFGEFINNNYSLSLLSALIMSLVYGQFNRQVKRSQIFHADAAITDFDNALDWLNNSQTYEDICMDELSGYEWLRMRMRQMFVFPHPSNKSRVAALMKLKVEKLKQQKKKLA